MVFFVIQLIQSVSFVTVLNTAAVMECQWM